MSETLFAAIAYARNSGERPRYFANDHSRDTVVIDAQMMAISDARGLSVSLDREGFMLVSHKSAIVDFTDGDQAAAFYPLEIAALITAQTGADFVQVTVPGVIRFSEKSANAGTLNNSLPARFAHVDVSDATAAEFAERSCPEVGSYTRAAHYNIWRAFSGPPQDVPLALCDARSVRLVDLMRADAVFDSPDSPEWSFEGLVVVHNPAHRWHWFSNLHQDEVLIFKTNDSDPARAHCVPHVAFDNPTCPSDAIPRASIEMRAIGYWFG
jgi:hypothetical protein